MSRTKTKRYLMLLAAVGLIAAGLGGTGTFASFNAQTTNGGNTFQTGSLVLSNAVDTATACYSSDTGNTNNVKGCTTLFGSANWQPGDPAVPVKLTLENTGSLTPTALTWWAPLLTTAGSEIGGTDSCNYRHYTPSGSHPYVGSGDPCAGITLQIQEYTSNTFLVAKPSCVFPAGGAACSTFAPLNTLSATPATIPGGLAPATPRYFLVTVQYPAANGSADNAYQAEQAFFNLSWKIQ